MTKLPPHIVWLGIVVAFLLMSVTMVVVTVVAATSDPSFAVVDDYYEKGLRWDEKVAQDKKNQELGWRAVVEVGAPDAAGLRAFAVRVADRDGVPIEGASVRAWCFHHAAAHRVQALGPRATGEPGRYEAPADIGREGLWDVSVEVTVGGELFTDTQTLDLEW